MFKRILVPVDFSAPSAKALAYAVDLGRSTKAELILVHAVESIYYVGGDVYGQFYDTGALLDQIVRSGREQLSRLARTLAKKRLRVRTVLEIGTAHEVIVRAARRFKADVIVLSTHGRTGLAHVFMGSVAEKVVRFATCPVLTVRGLKAGSRRVGGTRRRARRAAKTRAIKRAGGSR